jgi:hypothetical protein
LSREALLRLRRRRRRRRLLPACAVLSAAALALIAGLSDGGVPRAAGLTGAPELVAQTDDSVPAKDMTLIGAAPGEASAEVWGLAQKAGSSVLVRYAQDTGWTLGPPLQDSTGAALSGFQLDKPEAFRHPQPSPLAGQMVPDGAGAMLGTVGSGATAKQVLLVRNPGGAFKEAPIESSEEQLHEGEKLFGFNGEPMLTALEEPGGGAGALVVPVAGGGVDSAVLHWNGKAWSREAIEIPSKSSEQLQVVAIGASSPGNAWLLARLSPEYKSGSLALFHRHLGAGTPSWQPVTVKSGGEAGEPIEVEGETFTIPTADQAQILTVTSSGLWLDGQLRGAQASATIFFSPEGEANAGTVKRLWCRIPASSSATVKGCEEHPLPEALPTDFSRSFAWPGSGGFGERLITGLRDGQLLRLSGETFAAVNSLGGNAGATYGAAFASAQEGWLGKEVLPVHLTLATNAPRNRLAPWPVPFRFALTAVAPQPGAPVGAESSEVLAVGDRGEVARYHPHQGWFPETLPGPGGKRQTPRLRSVAWPTPERAYAVGDAEKGAGQMWLWRGETKLWEKDPAIPLNFRGNLLGIAFDPNNPSRGYAVGQSGALLRFGKSWTQEPDEALPPAARGASFTSIAFAGSEAIVAWRKLLHPGQNEYSGGILLNSGSGWHEDAAAAAALAGAVPWAVATLADGGAAFTAHSPTLGGTVYERNSPGAAWQPTQYPGGFAPGSLSLFREGSALRAIGTGSEPNTFAGEEEVAPPPGFPPILVDPYPLVSDPQRGVLRQTATGWHDEEHELNDAKEPFGGYEYWDTPYVPDPVSAVLVDAAGGQGWAVGGVVDNKQALLDTADIYRYPADGTPPPGVGVKPETTVAGSTALAVGGGAGCAAPCAARADTGTGPDAWLRGAVEEAGGIGGLSAFVYTGPGVTNGLTAGPPLVPVPWAAEEQHYAQRLSGHTLPVYPVAAPTDREGSGRGSEAAFGSAFPGAGCHGATAGCYYSVPVGAGPNPVRTIMLDNSLSQSGQREVPGEEIAWLGAELAAAGGRAIVVGNGDLPREYAEGRANAREVVKTIENGRAAAYFFDAPEQNVQETLTGAPGAVPAYGSGTLGYVNVLNEGSPGFIGQSGFLLAEVGAAPGPEGRYPVTVKLVPNVGELAMEAQQGTLLRRSQAASFAGLARRPRSGNRAHNQAVEPETAPYIAIPDNCTGAGCARGIEPFYEFTSSDETRGRFVQRNLQSSEQNAVLHNSAGEPITQPGGHDGLFCALNATLPNTPVTVTLKVGNLSYALPVTIQAGSVRQPCGTTRLNKLPVSATANTQPPPPPTEGGPAPASSSPVVPVPVPAPPAVPAAPPATHVVTQLVPAPFLAAPAPAAFLPAFVPVPVPTPARPTPPSGTSAVTSPVEAPQKEEEEEAAPESVSNEAVAYRQTEHEPPAVYLLGVIVLAAFAGASVRGRPGRRRSPRIAPATVTTSRTQRRWEREQERRR